MLGAQPSLHMYKIQNGTGKSHKHLYSSTAAESSTTNAQHAHSSKVSQVLRCNSSRRGKASCDLDCKYDHITHRGVEP